MGSVPPRSNLMSSTRSPNASTRSHSRTRRDLLSEKKQKKNLFKQNSSQAIGESVLPAEACHFYRKFSAHRF